jgi:hypothetical protein
VALRDEYATGFDDVTLKSIADKHGLKEQTVRTHAAKEKWSDARRQYRDKTSTKTQEKASTLEAEARARFVSFGKLMQARGAKRIQDLDPATLDADTARKLLKDGVEVEAKGLGIDDGSKAKVNLNLTPDDIARLSDEELDELRAKVAAAF